MKYYDKPSDILSQDILRRVEKLCTAEDPPACAAACPLHVDVKAMAGFIAKKDFRAAYQLYQKAVPFPRIVSAVCDAPCSGACLRTQRGGAIQIRKLERFITGREASPAKAPLFLPKKTGRIAISGGGLSGVTAALDLAKKGYHVELFEKSAVLCPELRTPGFTDLTDEDIETDLGALKVLPVKISFLSECPDSGFDYIHATDNTASEDKELYPAYSAIGEILKGRSAAATIDRLMQNVSVTAGREKEGPQKTGLFVNLTGVENSPPICPDSEFTEDAAIDEAARCIQCECRECVKNCSFLQNYKSHPGRYVREVYNNLSIPLGNHPANKMINTCALCSRCEAVCPNGLDMREIFVTARRRMVETGKMPPRAHEFALLDMKMSLGEDAFLAVGKGEYALFPGCQLAASAPGLTERVYNDLAERIPGGVSVLLSCCGIMAHWAGDDAALRAVKSQITSAWESLGKPTIAAACPSCVKTLGELYNLPVIGVWELLAEYGLPDSTADRPVSLCLHHACGARYDQNMRDNIKNLAVMAGARISELPEGEKSPCCGYGGLLPFSGAETADEMTAQTLDELGAGTVLTYCINCRDRYLKRGAASVHLLEFLYGGQTEHRMPTWSKRQENRALLKRSIQRKFGEVIDMPPKAKEMEIILSGALNDKMEEQKILFSDIEAALTAAENGGVKFQSRLTGGSITSFRPGNVTFWLEYETNGSKYTVTKLYTHRMLAELTHKSSLEVRDG